MEAGVLVRELLRRLDAADVDGVLALCAEDCAFSSPFSGGEIRGRSDLAAFLRDSLAGWREARRDVVSLLVDGDRAASEVRLEGVRADGARAGLEYAAIYELADGRVARMRIYADTGGRSG